MRRNAAFCLAALALVLCSYAWAEAWTQGTLSVSWNAQPPASFEPGVSFDASASANYDPNFPEGTEWYWISTTYTFSWYFSPDGSGAWSSNGSQSSASGSFSDPDDPGGDKVVGVNVDFDGEIHVDDGEGGKTVDVDEDPAVIELAGPILMVTVDKAVPTCRDYPKYLYCKVEAFGKASPPGGILTVWLDWNKDGLDHLTLNPPPTSFSPVAYTPWTQTFGEYTSDGTTTVGLDGNVKAKLALGGATAFATDKFFQVGK